MVAEKKHSWLFLLLKKPKNSGVAYGHEQLLVSLYEKVICFHLFVTEKNNYYDEKESPIDWLRLLCAYGNGGWC